MVSFTQATFGGCTSFGKFKVEDSLIGRELSGLRLNGGYEVFDPSPQEGC